MHRLNLSYNSRECYKHRQGRFRGLFGPNHTNPPEWGKKMLNAFRSCTGITTINIPAKKTDYYKKRQPKVLHLFITDNEEKKKKLVAIKINGIEKCLDARDENDDCISMFNRFSCDDVVFEVDGNVYDIGDFDETYE